MPFGNYKEAKPLECGSEAAAFQRKFIAIESCKGGVKPALRALFAKAGVQTAINGVNGYLNPWRWL